MAKKKTSDIDEIFDTGAGGSSAPTAMSASMGVDALANETERPPYILRHLGPAIDDGIDKANQALLPSNIIAGTNVSISRSGHNVTINSSGGGSGGEGMPIVFATASMTTKTEFSIVTDSIPSFPCFVQFETPSVYSEAFVYKLNGNVVILKSRNGEPINKPWLKGERVVLFVADSGTMYFEQGSSAKPINFLFCNVANNYLAGITSRPQEDGSLLISGTATQQVDIAFMGAPSSSISYGVLKAGKQYYFDTGLDSALPRCSLGLNYGLTGAAAWHNSGYFRPSIDLNLNYVRCTVPAGVPLNFYVKPMLYEVSSSITIPHALPDNYKVAKGETLELYFTPYVAGITTSLACHISGVGESGTRKWKFDTSTVAAGIQNVTLTVYENQIRALTKSFTVNVFTKVAPVATKVMMIGDSITNNGTPSAQYIMDKSTTDFGSNKFTFVGTLGTGTYMHEGRSGWLTSDYVSNKAGNPFWNPATSAVSFAYYTQQTGITPDVVNIMLGTNDVTNTGDIGLQTSTANLKTFIDRMKIDWPSVKIMLTIPPMVGLQDGLTSVRQRYMEYRGAVFASFLYRQFGSDARITIVPAFYCFDREYNYGMAAQAVNPFNPTTVLTTFDAIHPATATGMVQLGAIWYNALLSLYQ